MFGFSKARGFSTCGGVVIGMVLSLAICTSASADDFDFAGTINFHNDVLLFNFTTTSATTVTLFSSSWDDGGFDPMLGLWDSTGNLLQFQDDGGFDGSTLSNGVSYTHGVWDSYYSQALGAGTYTVSLTTYANFNLGGLLSDGFNYDGQTPIPIATWNQPANGIGTADFAFHVLNVESATGPGPAVPEPSTMLLFGSGLAALGAWRYRKSKTA